MKKQWLVVLCSLCVFSCTDNTPEFQVRPALVNVEINLSNIQYQSLRQIGGFVYLAGGHRGLVVIRKAPSEYAAYDRLCPNEPADDCGVVEMHESGLYLHDQCCESTFDFDGYPTSGPVKYALIRYNTYSDGSFLYISN